MNITQISNYLKEEIPTLNRKERLLFIGLTGLFVLVFLLFFQPFGVNNYDPWERITSEFFIFMLLMAFLAIFLLLLNELLLRSILSVHPTKRLHVILLESWNILWLSGGIFLFYNFIGNWHDLSWSSYVEFLVNVGTVYIIPMIASLVYLKIRVLNTSLDRAYSYNQAGAEDLIVFNSDNLKDQLSIRLENVLYLESEDNYIAIHYLDSNQISKSLLRKSLKSVQNESLHPALIRCHRSFIINLIHLQRIQGNRNKLSIHLKHIADSIPVSRQYMDEVYKLVS